jgi:predicted transcriptional regulator
MNYFKKILFAHSIIIISLLLCSCGTKHSISDNVIYKDDDFSYNQLKNGGVVIGGIASQRINFTREERIEYNSHLSTIMIKEFKDVRVINTLQLMYKIDTDNYYSLIKEYDTEQMLSNEDMRVIKESIPEIEYLIFVIIENENIRNNSYRESTADSDGKYKTVFKTTYSLTAEFQIYDLSREQMVWNNIMYNEAVKTQDRTEDSYLGAVVGDIMSGVFVSIDREDVLEEIYEELAEVLAEIQN